MKPVLSAAVAMMLALPAVAQTNTTDDRCDRIARQQSGYDGGRLPGVKVGPFNLRVSGSVAIGVSRSSGGAGVSVPAGAGEGAREMRRIRAEEDYREAYEACVAR